MRRATRATTAMVATIVALGLGGCGSSDKEASPPAPTTTTAPGDVMNAAAYDSALSTWATATNVGGLVDDLSAKGPFTVFAPDNDAFAKLKQKRLSALLRPANKKELAALLSGHVVKARIAGGDLKPGKVETLAGTTLTVTNSADGFVIADDDGHKATITLPPSTGTNGFVYKIDSVLGG